MLYKSRMWGFGHSRRLWVKLLVLGTLFGVLLPGSSGLLLGQPAAVLAADGLVVEQVAPRGGEAGYAPTVAVLWNEAMLAAVRSGPPRPTVIARSLYIVHASTYDAWSLYDPTAMPTVVDAALRRPAAERSEANQREAVSQAAYHALVALFPDYEKRTGTFGRLLQTLGYAVVTSADDTPSGIGYAAAQGVLEARASDGSNVANNYADAVSATFPQLYQAVNSGDPAASRGVLGSEFDPNRWEPIRVPTGVAVDAKGNAMVDAANPASFRVQTFLTPHWGAVRPFALMSGDQFRPPAPPKWGSEDRYMDGLGRVMTENEAYHVQVDEILLLSASLTDEQKVIAEYWADGPRSDTPPGHWNAIAHGVAYRDRHTLEEDVKLFLVLNGALFDASIAAWDAKRAYDCVRPVSAIRHKYAGQMVYAWGGPNQGVQLIRGEEWLPYQDLTFVTPPFSEFVSGHSTFSASAAAVLTQFTGSTRFYDGSTILYNEDFNRDGIPDLLGQHIVTAGGNNFEDSPAGVVVLQWETFQEAADEAGMSRRYGGIHFLDGDLRGRAMGRDIGTAAFDYAVQLWSGRR